MVGKVGDSRGDGRWQMSAGLLAAAGFDYCDMVSLCAALALLIRTEYIEGKCDTRQLRSEKVFDYLAS